MVNPDDYDDDTLTKAFWLQEQIKERGISGIHYMAKAESRVRQVSAIVTDRHIQRHLKRRL